MHHTPEGRYGRDGRSSGRRKKGWSRSKRCASRTARRRRTELKVLARPNSDVRSVAKRSGSTSGSEDARFGATSRSLCRLSSLREVVACHAVEPFAVERAVVDVPGAVCKELPGLGRNEPVVRLVRPEAVVAGAEEIAAPRRVGEHFVAVSRVEVPHCSSLSLPGPCAPARYQ